MNDYFSPNEISSDIMNRQCRMKKRRSDLIFFYVEYYISMFITTLIEHSILNFLFIDFNPISASSHGVGGKFQI